MSLTMRDIIIERLAEKHNKNKFDCGEDKLNSYIQKQAGQDSRKDVCVVYVATLANIDSSKILGFYTLSAAQIDISNFPDDIAKKLPRYPHMPAFRVGRLAVQKEFQQLGIGRRLLIDALEKCFKSNVSGIAAIVEVKNKHTLTFYQKYGFIQFPDQPLRLFMPMKVIRNLFSDEVNVVARDII